MSEAVPWGCPVCLRPFPELPGSVSVPPPDPACTKRGFQLIGLFRTKIRNNCVSLHKFSSKFSSREPCLFHRPPDGAARAREQARGDGAYRRDFRGIERGSDDPGHGRDHGVQVRGGTQGNGLCGACRRDRRAGCRDARFGARAPQRPHRRADPLDPGIRFDGSVCRQGRHRPYGRRSGRGDAQGGGYGL